MGPTASGKTALALAVADRLSGTDLTFEIVSADAMAIYRTMDIGTAKPTAAERARVPHHCIDVAEPTETYTVARYQADASAALAAVVERGAVPIVVGGTGLYVRSIVDSFTLPGQYPQIKAEIESEEDTELLWRRLDRLDPSAAAKMEPTNRRRIVRALEVIEGSGRPFSSFGPGVDHYPPTPYVLVGIEIERDLLDAAIDARYDNQLDHGFLAETERLLATGPSPTAAQALGYKELFAHLEGECSLEEAVGEAKRRTRRFARRQQRWFRRDPRIRWFDATDDELVERVVQHWLGQTAALERA